MTWDDHILKQSPGEGLPRRDFLKYCSTVAAAIGLGPAFGPKIFEAFAAPGRPPVLWLHFAECTGCTESVLRTTNPWLDDLIFNSVSLDYHETLLAAAGEQVESILYERANQYSGEFFCVVEGSIPTANGGSFGMLAGRPMLNIAEEICARAAAVISLGTCASFGGLAAAAPNPTGARGVMDALGARFPVPVVNVSGCPPNPINFVGTLATYLLNGRLPELDTYRRPLFAYQNTVHSQCPYRERESLCLEDQGCKGPSCRNNCPTLKFNESTSWPAQAGHPCIGCSEPNFWDVMTPFYRESDDEHDDDGHGNSRDSR